MTVDDLRAKLSELDGGKQVFVYWEDGKKTRLTFSPLTAFPWRKGRLKPCQMAK